MGTYFKPWRRKFGVVTLGLACLLMAIWLRSYYQHDEYGILDGRHYFISENGQFVRILRTPTSNQSHLGWHSMKAHPWRNPLTGHQFQKPFDYWGLFVVDWTFDGAGFHFGKGRATSWREPNRLEAWIIPYWSFTIPMMLLSVWLLLSTVRKPPVEGGRDLEVFVDPESKRRTTDCTNHTD